MGVSNSEDKHIIFVFLAKMLWKYHFDRNDHSLIRKKTLNSYLFGRRKCEMYKNWKNLIVFT